MLKIECPCCGARREEEFRCGGESHIRRPDPASCSDAEWADYLYLRSNPAGLHRERWCHSFGCGLWFNVLRDLTTHEIRAVYAMTEAAPALEEGS